MIDLSTTQGYFDVSVDPVSWMITQLSGQIMLSDDTTTISVTARWTQNITDIPRVVVYRKSSPHQWLSIGATRKRWKTLMGVRIWAKTHGDKAAAYQDLKERISDIAKSYSAAGYVWTHVVDMRPMDEPTEMPPVYSNDVDVELIYDEVVSYNG